MSAAHTINPISLASGVVPEFGPVETIEAAVAGGFDMVGLWVDPLIWTAETTRTARAALAQAGLPLLDVEVIWLKGDDALDAHRKVIDVGAELGARNVLCVSSDPDHARTAAHLAALCQHAEPCGMRVSLEFGIFTEVKTLTQALGVLRMVQHPLAALLIDPIHVDRSGSAIAEIAKVDPALLPYAQFCDAPAERPDPADMAAVIRDAVDLREQCGEGALPLAALYQAVPPGIPLSIELRSLALREAFPHPALRAAAVGAATRKWLETMT